MQSATWIGLGTLITAVAGLTLVAWQLREHRRTMRADFGSLYIQRYWAIDDDLLLVDKGSDLHRRHRHRYLRLFEDEFDVAALGFLDRPQWRVWHSVLDDERSADRVTEDLRVCNPEEDQFRRLRACIQQRDHDGAAHDVTICSGAPLRRRSRR